MWVLSCFPFSGFAMICFGFVGVNTDLSGVEESLRRYDTEHDEGSGGACDGF